MKICRNLQSVTWVALSIAFNCLSCASSHDDRRNPGEEYASEVIASLELTSGDTSNLAWVKAHQNEPGILDAKTALIAEADAILEVLNNRIAGASGIGYTVTVSGAYTVFDKHKTAPTGNKHDFYTIPIYFWPDLTKPDHLPWIPKDGVTNPTGNVGTDRKSFSTMTDSVKTLALAHFLTGYAKYATSAAKLLRVWFIKPATKMNPHLEFAQITPGIDRPSPRGIIDFHEFPALLDAIGMLNGAKEWTSTDQAGLQAWCRFYLIWLQTSKSGQGKINTITPDNQTTWYYAQTMAIALYTGDTILAKTIAEAVKVRVIRSQIDADGTLPRELERTKSFHYTLFNLRAMVALAIMAKDVNVDLWNYQTQGKSIRLVLDFVAQYADPSKQWPFVEILPGRQELMAQLLPLLKKANAPYNERYQSLINNFLRDEIRVSRVKLFYEK